MEKRYRGLIILIIVLFLLVFGLCGFIIYDKILSNDNTEINDNNVNNSILYSYNDFLGTTFSNEAGDNYLILWDNGTYSYNNTLGNYIIDNGYIILNTIFANGKIVSEKSQINLEILSITELKDVSKNIKINKLNQPTSPGGTDFYYYINLYKNEN